MGFMGSFASYNSVYKIPDNISETLFTSMILGVSPLGAVFSALFLPQVLKYINKR